MIRLPQKKGLSTKVIQPQRGDPLVKNMRKKAKSLRDDLMIRLSQKKRFIHKSNSAPEGRPFGNKHKQESKVPSGRPYDKITTKKKVCSQK
jgi:hypothetical protein